MALTEIKSEHVTGMKGANKHQDGNYASEQVLNQRRKVYQAGYQYQ